MNKLNYLKLAIENKLFYKKNWLISCFAITRQNSVNKEYIGQIFKEPWGYSFNLDGEKLEPIEEVDPNQPLFRFKDRITIDSSWCGNVQGTIETTIGNLLFNHICILTSFGPKYPFITGQVSVKKIEDFVATRLKDTPMDDFGIIDNIHQRSDEYFYVDEYVKFVDSLQFISNISQLTTWSATPKSLIAPTGIAEFKKQLNEKYAGKLNDPVELSKYEQELLDYDDQFLKDDPAYGTFLKGKIKHTARKKMFLSMGADKSFTDSLEVVPVTNSLEEGWPSDAEQFTAMMNGLRIGSFSRGAETVKGGVSAKILLRAGNNYTIVDTNCNTKLGITRIFDKSTIDKLIGRHIIDKEVILIENEDQAKTYLDRKILVRSPMYCRLTGPNICRICAGEKLFKFPKGVTIPLTEISSIILATSLSAMHSNTLSTAKLQIDKHFT